MMAGSSGGEVAGEAASAGAGETAGDPAGDPAGDLAGDPAGESMLSCMSLEDCDLGEVCADEVCVVGECTTDADCDDQDTCNGDEVCDEQLRCQSGVTLQCESSASPCSVSACDPDTGCEMIPVEQEISCDDGDPTTPHAYCDAGACIGCDYRTGPIGASVRDTGWYQWSNLTFEEVGARVEEGYRLAEIDVISANPLRFSVVMVQNQGAFETPWWWYYDLTQERLDELLAQNQARLLDFDAYVVNGEVRFAVIMGLNTGAYYKPWWYAYGSSGFISNIATENDARIVELDEYTFDGQQRYAAVLIANQGEDQRAWWHYYNVTSADALAYARDHSAQIHSVVGLGSGRVSVVMARSPSAWWFYAGLSSREVYERVKRNGARLVDFNSYQVNGRTLYAAAMVNNLNAPGARMSNLLRTGVNGGELGAYLKRVNGEVLVNYNAYDVFEPASSIKTLHLLTAMLRVDRGTLGLDDLIPYCGGITGSSCPVAYDDCRVPQMRPVRELASEMMQVSSNTATQSFRALLGEAEINQSGVDVGMRDSLVQHRIGCGSDPSGDFGLNSAPNQLTLRDIGVLHEAVVNGALTDPTQSFFWSAMTNNIGFIDAIIDEEAAALGLDDRTISAFKRGVSTARKGGSYNSAGLVYRSGTGLLRLPFKCGAEEYIQEYVFGVFVNLADGVDSDFSTWEMSGEVSREEIREALSTWR